MGSRIRPAPSRFSNDFLRKQIAFSPISRIRKTFFLMSQLAPDIKNRMFASRSIYIEKFEVREEF